MSCERKCQFGVWRLVLTPKTVPRCTISTRSLAQPKSGEWMTMAQNWNKSFTHLEHRTIAIFLCSATSRNAKMVAYETRTAGSLLQREVPAHLLFGKNLLRAVFRLQYTAVSRKVVGKNVHARIPKGNMGYNQYTVFWHSSCRNYFCCFSLALSNILSMVPRAILSKCFEKQLTKPPTIPFAILAWTLFSDDFSRNSCM